MVPSCHMRARTPARAPGSCAWRGAARRACPRGAAAAAAAALVEPAQLAAIAAEPVAEVALLAAAGAACARQGLLPLQGRRMLSGLVMNVFTPALLFSKLGSSVDVQHVAGLWPLAANMAACHAAGLGLGWLQAAALRVPAALRPQTLVMVAMGNVGNMPLVLLPALLARPGVAGLLGGGGGGNAAAEAAAAATSLGLTYVMVGFFCASFIQFPLGYLLLQRPDQQHEPALAATAAQQPPPRGPQQQQQQPALAAAWLVAAEAGAAPPGGAAPLPAWQAAGGPSQQQAQQQQQQQQQQQAQQQQRAGRLEVLARGVFTPPVIACLLSVPVAASPQLHAALFSPAGELRFVGDVTALLGAPLIPCLFLVLGANLAEGPGKAQVSPAYAASLVANKLLLHPLLGLGCCLAALRSGLLPASTDPLMLLVMLLVWTSPTAVLVHSLATLLQNGEDEVSFLLFYEYLACLVTLPAWLAVYLQLLAGGVLAGGGA